MTSYLAIYLRAERSKPGPSNVMEERKNFNTSFRMVRRGLHEAFKKVDDDNIGIKPTKPRLTDEEWKAYKKLSSTIFGLFFYSTSNLHAV